MKRQFFLGCTLALLAMAPVSGAGGTNKLVMNDDRGDGFLRVQTSRGSVLLSEIRTPKFKATMNCPEDGYRVWKVGTKVMPEPLTKTTEVDSWEVDAGDVTLASTGSASLQAARKSQLGSACTAGHAAVLIPIAAGGMCRKIKGLNAGNPEAFSVSTKVAMGIECAGYAVTKKPLILFRQDLNPIVTQNGKSLTQFVALPASANTLATRETAATPYGRVSVEGQVWTQSGAGRRALYLMTKPIGKRLRETLASDPATIAELVSDGYAKGAVQGWVATSPGAGTTPLFSYKQPTTEDVVTIAMPRQIGVLQDQRGYKLVRVEGYMAVMPNL